MNKISFDAFSSELRAIQVADTDTPTDYLETRTATMVKLGLSFSPGGALVGGIKKMVGPASRAGQFLGQHGDALGHGAELAGLGMLARHPVQELGSKDPNERSKARWETAGLGTLAAAPAMSLGKHLLMRH